MVAASLSSFSYNGQNFIKMFKVCTISVPDNVSGCRMFPVLMAVWASRSEHMCGVGSQVVFPGAQY